LMRVELELVLNVDSVDGTTERILVDPVVVPNVGDEICFDDDENLWVAFSRQVLYGEGVTRVRVHCDPEAEVRRVSE